MARIRNPITVLSALLVILLIICLIDIIFTMELIRKWGTPFLVVGTTMMAMATFKYIDKTQEIIRLNRENIDLNKEMIQKEKIKEKYDRMPIVYVGRKAIETDTVKLLNKGLGPALNVVCSIYPQDGVMEPKVSLSPLSRQERGLYLV